MTAYLWHSVVTHYLSLHYSPEPNLQQMRPVSGEAQTRKEPEYEEINDFQKTNEGSISGNMSESSLYVNLNENGKPGFSNRPRVPTPPRV